MMVKTMLPVLMCLLYISVNSQGFTENSVNASIPADQLELIVDRSSGVREEAKKVFHANAYAHGHCNYAKDPFQSGNCTATVMHFNQRGVIGTHICGISRFIQPMTTRKEHQIRFLFEKNKAIFVYESEDGNSLYQNYEIVEPRSDSCTRSHASIRFGFNNSTFIRQMNVATYTNIIVQDDGKFYVIADGDCGGARCKYSFDGEAKQIGGPDNYLPLDYQNHSVKVFPSTKSEAHFAIVGEWPLQFQKQHLDTQVYFTEHAFDYEKLLYVEDGTITELGIFNHSGVPFHDIFVDNSNGLFSFCRNDHVGVNQERNYELHCMQFSESTVKFNGTYSIKIPERLLSIYNLPTGGILVVKSKCPTELTCEGLKLEKWALDPTDQMLLSIEDVRFSSKILKTIVHVEEENKLCLTVYSEAQPGYNIFVECFANPFFNSGADAQSYISIINLIVDVMMVLCSYFSAFIKTVCGCSRVDYKHVISNAFL